MLMDRMAANGSLPVESGSSVRDSHDGFAVAQLLSQRLLHGKIEHVLLASAESMQTNAEGQQPRVPFPRWPALLLLLLVASRAAGPRGSR